MNNDLRRPPEADQVNPEQAPSAEEKLPPGAHRSPPQGYPTDRDLYAIPQWYALPIDTPEHARNAASRFSQMDIYGELLPEEQQRVWHRIAEAEIKFGIKPGEHVLQRAGLLKR
ncbi:MAG: DUF6582 domain-containing protein [Sulfobacillus sp.]